MIVLFALAGTRAEAAPPDGATLFNQNCVACHGPTGAGDGPAAAALDPKPRKLGSADIMGKISDEQIAKVVKNGGAANGKSALMPPFAQLSDADVKALIAHIRSLCKCSFKS
ncbi:MAG: cytochrome c [Myxococcota bacterium]